MRIDKDPTVLLDLVRLDLDAALVLLVDRLLELLAQLVHDDVDVAAAPGRGKRIFGTECDAFSIKENLFVGQKLILYKGGHNNYCGLF